MDVMNKNVGVPPENCKVAALVCYNTSTLLIMEICALIPINLKRTLKGCQPLMKKNLQLSEEIGSPEIIKIT